LFAAPLALSRFRLLTSCFQINKKFKFLQIDIDGIFQCMLLLRKKKYAALKISELPSQSGDKEQVWLIHFFVLIAMPHFLVS
jgi:hypothetical protein